MSTSKRKAAVENKTVFISCIVPVFNEEAVVEAFLLSLQDTLSKMTQRYEIIVVDDGSHDHTIANIRNLPDTYPIKLLGLSRNFGKEVAITAGLEHCSGDIAIIIDADFQHPVEMLPEFVAQWAEGNDMVYGIRIGRESESYLKRNFARMFYWLMQQITQIDIPSNAGDFRLMDQSVVAAIKLFPERTRFMKGLYAWVGFKKIGIPYQVQNRIAGKSSWHFSKLTELAITGITSFSDVPLRVWGFIGFVISLISLIYALYFATITLIYGADSPGFPTLVVAIMFLGGVQLLSIGILGEYIARIFTEVKQRPKYLLRIKDGFNE